MSASVARVLRLPHHAAVVIPISYSVGGRMASQPGRHLQAWRRPIRSGRSGTARVNARSIHLRARALHRCRGRGAGVSGRRDCALQRPSARSEPPTATHRRRARRHDARSPRAAAAVLTRVRHEPPVRRRSLRRHAQPPWRAGALDRRHVDNGRERTECGRGAPGSRRGCRGGRRDRSASQSGLAPER